VALYLIPTPLSQNYFPTLPINDIIQNCNVFVVEHIRNARRFIRLICKNKDIDLCTFWELDKHTRDAHLDVSWLDTYYNTNKDIVLLSDSGIPCVADPGRFIVAKAHVIDMRIIPINITSSIMSALSCSGCNGQQFIFHGYLAIERQKRLLQLKQIEQDSTKITQIFMETPYRNQNVWIDMLSTLNPKTLISISIDLTADTEYIKTKKVEQWKHITLNLHKRPTIFVIGQ